ncbi:MAG TPA: sugar transferase [Caulobacteraceae bacterium]|jgi:lipopolysaccharide/colanic/teichoic acid biosynthesis glycosyltransferase
MVSADAASRLEERWPALARLAPAAPRWRADAAFLGVAFAVSFLAAPQLYRWIVSEQHGPQTQAVWLHILANAAANFAVMLGAWSSKGRLDERLGRVISLALATHGLVALAVVATRSFYSNSLMIFAALASVALGLATVIARRRLKPPRIAVIGAPASTLEQLPAPFDWIGDPSEDLRGFDLILTESGDQLPLEWTRAVARAMLAGKPVRHCAEYLEEARGLVSIDHFDIDQLPAGGLASYQSLKRVTDAVLAALALPIALPLVALAGLAILVTMGRPIFFVQSRVGLGGRTFKMFKLRTMTAGEVRPAVEGRMAVAEGQRITALGAVLRRLRIDELPQLWHVLVGEMSFIGPRPEWTRLAERYAAQLPTYDYRHVVRPGITGWAQVRSGYAGNLEETKLKVAYDLYYLKHLSLGLDLQILLRTVVVLLTTWGSR